MSINDFKKVLKINYVWKKSGMLCVRKLRTTLRSAIIKEKFGIFKVPTIYKFTKIILHSIFFTATRGCHIKKMVSCTEHAIKWMSVNKL